MSAMFPSMFSAIKIQMKGLLQRSFRVSYISDFLFLHCDRLDACEYVTLTSSQQK